MNGYEHNFVIMFWKMANLLKTIDEMWLDCLENCQILRTTDK